MQCDAREMLEFKYERCYTETVIIHPFGWLEQS